MKKINKKQIDRIWSKVKKTDSCWIWTAGCFSSGYASVSIFNHTFKLSRVIYKIAFGPIPKGLLVLHSCDNRKCVNPDHLFLGTAQDNTNDMVLKGRMCSGTKHPLAKLDEKKVEKIRKMFETGKYSYADLGYKFYVDRSLIRRIILNLSWKKR